VTAIADLLTRTDRERLLKHMDEMADLGRLMRERGTLAEPAAQPLLHGMSPRDADRKTKR
jgi:hypothetical protein